MDGKPMLWDHRDAGGLLGLLARWSSARKTARIRAELAARRG